MRLTSGESELLSALRAVAFDLSQTVATILQHSEGILLGGSDTDERGGLDPEAVTAAEYLAAVRKAVPSRQSTFLELNRVHETERDAVRERVAAIVLRAWASASRTGPSARPDVLSIVAEVLANPNEPQTHEIARYAVVLSLRLEYGITYESATIGQLRRAYDIMRPEGRRPPTRKDTRLINATGLLQDLLCLDGWMVRCYPPAERQRYYEHLRQSKLGVMADGRATWDRAFLHSAGKLPEFGQLLNRIFGQPTAVPGLDFVTGGLLVPVSDGASRGLVTLIAGPRGVARPR